MQILGRLLIKLDMWTPNRRAAPNVPNQIHEDKLANIFLWFLFIHLSLFIAVSRSSGYAFDIPDV